MPVERRSEEALGLARELYRLFAAGDIGFFDLLGPEIEWQTPFGDFQGPDEVIDYLEQVNAAFDEPRPEPEEFIGAGDTVVVLGTWRGKAKATGVEVEARFAHVWRCRSGMMVSCRNYLDSAKVEQALNSET